MMLNRIREFRELKGWSQQQLADAVSTSQPQIDRLEKGERKLSQEWMQKLAPALGVDVATLIAPKATDLRVGLKALRKRVGLSPAEIARAVGVPTDDYTAWEEKRASVPDNLTQPLANVFASKGVPSHDLVTLAGIERQSDQAEGARAIRSRETGRAERIMILELDVKAAAGAGAADPSEIEAGAPVMGEWQVPASWVQQISPHPKPDLRVIPVIGDSMEPLLQSSTRVFVDVGDTLPSPPGIFVVWDGLGLVVKRVEYMAHSDPPTVEISSANPAYKAYRRTLEEAHIWGRVIGRWTPT
jgi:transcriptional regulator with XRE-family HTH domain